MGEKHKVYFEPVGIEIEVDEVETILDAAFRHGVMLMHGCKEGQCSACKSFLIEGDLEMGKYSTFALNETELDEGYVLLCKSHAYSDLEIEFLSFHDEMMNTGIPIQLVYAEVEAVVLSSSRVIRPSSPSASATRVASPSRSRRPTPPRAGRR